MAKDDYKIVEVEQADGSIKFQVEGYEKLFDTKDEAKKWALAKGMEDATDMPEKSKGAPSYRSKSEKTKIADDKKKKPKGKK